MSKTSLFCCWLLFLEREDDKKEIVEEKNKNKGSGESKADKKDDNVYLGRKDLSFVLVYNECFKFFLKTT